MLILWAWTAVLSAFVLFPVFDHQANAFVPIGVGVLGVALYTLFHPGVRSRADRRVEAANLTAASMPPMLRQGPEQQRSGPDARGRGDFAGPPIGWS